MNLNSSPGLRIVLALCIVVGGAECADAVAPNAVGVWGGPHVRLEITNMVDGVSTAGAATVEFDCAHGSISVPVTPDKSGRFEAFGYYVQDHGGPVRADQALTANPARYSGEVNGSQMTLTVTRTDTTWSAGPFTPAPSIR